MSRTPWSILTHGDLPPAPGRAPSPPDPDGPFPDGIVPSAPPLSKFDTERIERQRAVASAIRGAIERMTDRPRWKMLRDRALLIEVADHVDEVLELLDEVRDLGVEIERQS
ncbi:MAG: hypothetical protein ACRDMH_05240 [Solirubrobacterales bacterium]